MGRGTRNQSLSDSVARQETLLVSSLAHYRTIAQNDSPGLRVVANPEMSQRQAGRFSDVQIRSAIFLNGDLTMDFEIGIESDLVSSRFLLDALDVLDKLYGGSSRV